MPEEEPKILNYAPTPDPPLLALPMLAINLVAGLIILALSIYVFSPDEIFDVHNAMPAQAAAASAFAAAGLALRRARKTSLLLSSASLALLPGSFFIVGGGCDACTAGAMFTVLGLPTLLATILGFYGFFTGLNRGTRRR
jgi:hypothetical protein